MIAAGLGRLFFNTFDVAVVLILAFGFWRGRKNGMAKELLPLAQWLLIVFGAGLGYEWLGDRFIQWGVVKNVFGTNVTEKTAAYLSAYLLITVFVWFVFSFIKRHLKKKVEGSNVFGGGEYYLGMLAGVIRYACMIIFALALLNAPYYSAADIAARQAYNNRWYGGGLKDFKGDFIPSLDEVQTGVFRDSLLGPYIKKDLGVLLINALPATEPTPASVISLQ
jgi:hypothetical protein